LLDLGDWDHIIDTIWVLSRIDETRGVLNLLASDSRVIYISGGSRIHQTN